MGIVFQRSLLVTTTFAVVLVLPIWLNVGKILTHLGAVLTDFACEGTSLLARRGQCVLSKWRSRWLSVCLSIAVID